MWQITFGLCCLFIFMVQLSYPHNAHAQAIDETFSLTPSFTLQMRQDLSLRRARAQIVGNALSPALRYEVDVSLSKDQVSLKDFFLHYNVNPGLQWQGGQFKIPLSEQFAVSGTQQQFAERSIAHQAFSPGRAPGISLFGEIYNPVWLYQVGVFQAPESLPETITTGFFGSLQYEPLGTYGRGESDWEAIAQPRVRLKTALWQAGTLSTKTSIFGGIKWKGLSFNVHGFSAWDAQSTHWGAYAQLGYFLWHQRLEAVARSAFSTPEGLKHEYALGLNYYFQDHHFKFQSDYHWWVSTTLTQQWLAQVQVLF